MTHTGTISTGNGTCNYSRFSKNNGKRRITIISDGNEPKEAQAKEIRRTCTICNSSIGLAEKFVVIDDKNHHIHCPLPISGAERGRVSHILKKEYIRLKIIRSNENGFLSDTEHDNWRHLEPIFE